jgi:hypothetical protein
MPVSIDETGVEMTAAKNSGLIPIYSFYGFDLLKLCRLKIDLCYGWA